MAANDLTTLANLRGWLQVTGTGDDAVLERLITSVSARIVTYCSRPFIQAAYSDVYDGKDTLSLPFANFPVTAVSSLTIDGVSVPAAPAPTSSSPTPTGYVFTPTMLSIAGGYRFTRGYQNVAVSYTAGYASNALPTELEQACIELCSIRYSERGRIGQQSKSISGETVSFFRGDLTDSVKGMLAPFRRVVPR